MTTLVMSSELERDVRLLADATNTSANEAVADAVRRRLQQVESPDTTVRRIDLDKVKALIHRNRGVIDYSFSEDSILGYDEDGIPEQIKS